MRRNSKAKPTLEVIFFFCFSAFVPSSQQFVGKVEGANPEIASAQQQQQQQQQEHQRRQRRPGHGARHPKLFEKKFRAL